MTTKSTTKWERSHVLAAIGLASCIIGTITSVLAFGLPYWVYFDETLSVTQSGTAYDVQLIYHYGFWGYCNKVSSEILNSQRCEAAKTSSDSEQTAVSLLVLAILFTISGAVNISLYLWLKVLMREKFCLYMACTSEILAGVMVTAGVIHFGLQDHSVTISETIILNFTASNLHASFWLAVTTCVCIAIATGLTLIAIATHRKDADEEDTKSMLTSSFITYPSKKQLYGNEDSTSVTLSSPDYFLSAGRSTKTPFYEQTDPDDSSDDDLLLSKAPISTVLLSPQGPKFGLKDHINWREAKQQSISSSTSKEEVNDSKQPQDETTGTKGGILKTSRNETGIAETVQDTADGIPIDTRSNDNGSSKSTSLQSINTKMDHHDDSTEKASEKSVSISSLKHNVTFADMTPVETTIDTSETIRSPAEIKTQAELPHTSDNGITTITVEHSQIQAPIDTASGELRVNDLQLERPNTEMSFSKESCDSPVTRPKTAGGVTTNGRKKKCLTREQQQLEAYRLERCKTLTSVYGGSSVRIGAMGSIPVPNPLLKHTKKPSEEVVRSGKKLMVSLQAYKKMRRTLDRTKSDPEDDSKG